MAHWPLGDRRLEEEEAPHVHHHSCTPFWVLPQLGLLLMELSMSRAPWSNPQTPQVRGLGLREVSCFLKVAERALRPAKSVFFPKLLGKRLSSLRSPWTLGALPLIAWGQSGLLPSLGHRAPFIGSSCFT